MASPTFKKMHSGIEITMTNGGQFSATVNTKKVLKPSLKAMQDFIDKQNAFTPFDAMAFTYRYGTDTLKKVRIVGCVRKERRWGNSEFHWIDDTKQRHSTVYPLNAEPLIKAAAELKKKHRKETEVLDAAHKKAMKVIEDKIIPVPPPDKSKK